MHENRAERNADDRCQQLAAAEVRVSPFISGINVPAENDAAFGFARGFSAAHYVAGAPFREKRVQKRFIE